MFLWSSFKLSLSLVCVLCLWNSRFIVAQDYLTQQYTLPAPTSQTYSSTHSIAQDCEGYLWVETSEGLARYDGQDFKVYSIYNKQLQAAKYTTFGVYQIALYGYYNGIELVGEFILMSWI